jgi:uncharacterized protein (UPF0276 family)
MAKIWLAATGGRTHINALLVSGEADVDRLKAGEWMDAAQLAALVALRPALLHVSHGVLWPRSKRWAAKQARLARRVDAPWISVHLDIGWTFLAYRWAGPTPIGPVLGKRWAVRTLRRLQAVSLVPVLAENMARWTRHGPAYVFDPAFISSVVEEAGCGFLLDLAHARVAACYRGEPVQDYLARLPLDRTIEIHVSGPRPLHSDGAADDSRLFDAHEPLQEEDYALLDWVLQRTRPQAVTLEYSQDRAQLETQLHRLRALLDSHSMHSQVPGTCSSSAWHLNS